MLLKNIQFLRGAAALAVILYHLAPHFLNTKHFTQSLHAFFVQFGYAGVDVFFVISGYVIWISTYGLKNKPSSGLFAYKRAARIYLGYWPYFFITAALIWYFAPEKFSPVNMLGSFLLTELTIPHLILQVAWTLSFELYFYLIFTICLLFSIISCKRLLVIFAALIISVQAYAVSVLDVYSMTNLPTASPLFTFFFSPFCLQFLAGVAVAIYFEKNRLRHLKTALLLCFLTFAFTLWYQANVLVEGHYLSMGYYAVIRVVLYGLVAVLLVSSMVEIEKRGKTIWPQLADSLGDASYSLYLSHIPILFVFGQLGMMKWGRESEWQHVITYAVILFTIIVYSLAHYRIIESPLMQWAKAKGKTLFKQKF